ncbi:hypothetical protein [Paenibacillus paeoniae]|uniref:hypothetical protein n=1 Tax=Paenibacillus paeoniae TaxID=2292705 RepID=UPI0014036249|nr:hypothetical protein [Paenibacillus paeoniae]
MNIAHQDQLVEAIKDLAFLTRTHYDNLIKAGFTPSEALQLTIAFQRDSISK